MTYRNKRILRNFIIADLIMGGAIAALAIQLKNKQGVSTEEPDVIVRPEIIEDTEIEKSTESINEFDEMILEEAYDAYVEGISNIIKKTSSERNILNDYAIYMTMLNNSCLSLNDYEFGETSVEVPSVLGANIALGEGTNQNVTANCCDVFKKLGYEAGTINGKLYTNESVIDENHELVYVDDGKTCYLVDASDGKIFLRKSELHYLSLESQEDRDLCFDIPFSLGSDDMLKIIASDDINFKKHWNVLKEYRAYEKALTEYVTTFDIDEKEYLENSQVVIEDKINKYKELKK